MSDLHEVAEKVREREADARALRLAISAQLTIEDDNIIHGEYEFGRVNALTMIRAERRERDFLGYVMARPGLTVADLIVLETALDEMS